MNMSPTNLRDTLLASLATLPGTREFHIHVLITSPRKHSGLFPYAHPRPRVYLQDVLILLSEQSTPDSPRVLVTAVEASVYNIPTTSCGILYISKVDSSGQGGFPSPTATLVRSLLTYYTDPETRPIAVDTLWTQLFARAQAQYLFPNSADFPGKHPLSDVKLCAWWKRIFSEVARELEARTKESVEKVKTKLYYVLPGYSELEAVHSLHIQSSSAFKNTVSTPQWTYGHPYSQTDIPLPCPQNKGSQSLGHYIPCFDDDPKSRFMDEIAHTRNDNIVKSPKRKRPKTTLHKKPDSRASNGSARPREVEDVEGDEEETTHHVEGELEKVTPAEFWERMSFRQECIAGAVTGFFALGTTCSPSEPSEDLHSRTVSVPSPLVPQPGQVAPRLVRRIVSSLMTAHEFSTLERAVRATETLEDAIKGLCENIATISATTNPNLSSSAHLLPEQDITDTNPESLPALQQQSSSSTDLPEVPRTPPNRKSHLPDLTLNPFPEPETSLETYHSYIYGSVHVNNPPLPPKIHNSGAVGTNGASSGDLGDGKVVQTQPVTILAVRKKKRKVE